MGVIDVWQVALEDVDGVTLPIIIRVETTTPGALVSVKAMTVARQDQIFAEDNGPEQTPPVQTKLQTD